jgi:hypothetical protein
LRERGEWRRERGEGRGETGEGRRERENDANKTQIKTSKIALSCTQSFAVENFA